MQEYVDCETFFRLVHVFFIWKTLTTSGTKVFRCTNLQLNENLQGSIISPFLWNILIDDVFSSNINCAKIAYANDCFLIITAHNFCDLMNKANRIMHNFNKICSNIKLKINPNKTEYMIIKKRIIPPDSTIKLNDKILRRKNSVKYLRGTIDSKLNFNEHVKKIITSSLIKLNPFYQLGNLIWSKPNLKTFVFRCGKAYSHLCIFSLV